MGRVRIIRGKKSNASSSSPFALAKSAMRRFHNTMHALIHPRHGGRHRIWYAVALSFLFCLIFFNSDQSKRPAALLKDLHCSGRYIFVHDLPPRFNSDLLRDCRALNPWVDMCQFNDNAGLGPALGHAGGDWYATNQFALDLIFHNRMKQYDCLTTDSSRAAAVFVPFYAGLEVGRHLWGQNATLRDSSAMELVRWLRARPEWAAMGGRDHFLVAGRITWDFRRYPDDEHGWGSKFLFMPETKNMTVLIIESSPWASNDFAIPYPTYFHPSKDGAITAWQDEMRKQRRPWLFCFAGAARPNMTGSIRDHLIAQCADSRRCNLLECVPGSDNKCNSPERLMEHFRSSVFCLQPQGDSYTRRSTFDGMVAGCVPVFFHPGSAYAQYEWHLPRNHSKYSVFISEDEVREGKVRIEEVLRSISSREVAAMREEVIRMIPRLVYGDPRHKLETFKDAFDVAVEGVIERVRRMRKGAAEEVQLDEHDSWRRSFAGEEGGGSQWEHFFEKM
ncbi:xyloglucan galactosyltransferase [Canna indica]|uniref:Xyloglucan galactosyltransferase n=1 Tax=Canna indica TaxID=4628 RepID=A0AAQ3KXM8_9LILI|nr:xyloglucan galactosyltransferase [Canna indica]